MSDFGTVEEIRKKIQKQMYLTEAKDASKNPLWSYFLSIVTLVDGDKQVIPFVSCKKCTAVLSYDSVKGGTSHLRRHVDGCSVPTSGQSSISNFFKGSGLPKAAKDLVTSSCVNFVCKDMRPFSVVSGDGFLEVAQSLINVGVRYGQVKASDVIPHRTTISRQVDLRAKAIKKMWLFQK
jgi:hypothetical protein